MIVMMLAAVVAIASCGDDRRPDTVDTDATDAPHAAAHATASPSTASSYKTRVIGLVGGIGAALLLLVLFKNFWFDGKHYLLPRTVGNLTCAEASKLGSLADDGASNPPPSDFSQFNETPTTMPPSVSQVIKIRCPYCAGLLDEFDRTCHQCGGAQ